MGTAYGRIIERMFDLDPLNEYVEIDKFLRGLETKPSEMNYPQLADELEQVENHAWRATRLFAHAQDQKDAFERDIMVEESALLSKAKQILEEKKRSGEFTKSITIGDVEGYAAGHFTAEYKDIANRRSKAKRMVEALERAADLLKRRRETLDTLVKGAR